MARAYSDNHWDAIEAPLEAEFGLPKGGMKAIRTRGERSNADQVSPVGARTVYQIMPNTRRLFSKAYGVDAYADDDGRSAARVAALHLRDDMKKHGWAGAVTRYIGGPDPSKWGQQTRDYVHRVTGQDVAGNGYTPSYYADEPIKDFSGDWLHSRPADPSTVHAKKETPEERRVRLLKATSGRDNLYTTDTVGTKDVGAAEIRDNQIDQAKQTVEDDKITPWQRLSASWHDNTLTASIIRHLDEQHSAPEPGHVDYYMKNRDKIEEGYDEDERDQLRESTSLESLNVIRNHIADQRQRRELYMGRGVKNSDPTGGVLYALVGGVADPAGIVAGEGLGKVLQLGGVGARALYAARRPIAGTISLAGEFAAGNVAITGGMDLMGDHYTSKDYASAAGLGGAMALAMSPFHLHGGRVDTTVADHFNEQAAYGQTENAALHARAADELGPGATPDEIATHAQKLDADDQADLIRVTLADQPDQLKVMSDHVLTQDEGVRASVEQQHGLDLISDDAERATATEMTARLARIVKDNPIDDSRLNPLTSKMGLQSTGISLLKSKSVVLRGLGVILTEGTTGAAGRRRTAALGQNMLESMYNEELRGYTGLYKLYRNRDGVGAISEAVNGKKWREFEREVFLEIERRGDETGYIPHERQEVREAADLLERGYDIQRQHQQHVGTVGNARLGTHSRGYTPHRISGEKLQALDLDQRRSVSAELSRQFQANEGFDKKFSDKLGAKYVEQAIRRSKGGADVPMNLHDPYAADVVEDALRAMALPPEELDKLLGKFSRGGAGHTKARLKLNLDADIGGGKKLVDLFDTSASNLYRGYSRRVSGEVALAQFGIMGRKGLNVLRAAADATGASADDLKAFDQVAAEFLNTPFGNHNHAWMDNVRLMASNARLGGMGFTQLGEYGNGIIALGAQRVMTSMGDMPRLVQEVRAIYKGGAKPNPVLQSLDQVGGHLGMDEFNNTRLFDVPDNDIKQYANEHVGVVSRYLRAGANTQAILSGHRMILGVQVRGMSEQIVRKAMHYVRTGAEDAALDDMGIDATLRGRLRENLDHIATFKGNKLENLDLMKGDLTGHEIMTLRAAVMRGAGQIIQKTYIGESGKWAHDGFLKMLTQFRTFGIVSIEKQWGRTKATHGALKSFAYTLGAMSFAAPIYMARVQTKMLGMDDDKAKEYGDKYLTPAAIGLATMNYASSTGIASDMIDMGVGFAGGLGMDLPDDVAARGRQRGGFIGGQIAPGVGIVNDIYDGATNLRTPDGKVNQGSVRKLSKALPGSNLPFVQPIWNGLGSSD